MVWIEPVDSASLRQQRRDVVHHFLQGGGAQGGHRRFMELGIADPVPASDLAKGGVKGFAVAGAADCDFTNGH